MAKFVAATLGTVIVLVISLLMFVFAYLGLSKMIGEAKIYSDWNVVHFEMMLIFMLVAFLMAVIAAVVALVLELRK